MINNFVRGVLERFKANLGMKRHLRYLEFREKIIYWVCVILNSTLIVYVCMNFNLIELLNYYLTSTR